MKKPILILLAFLSAISAANADNYYLCYTKWELLYFAKIPTAGVHDSLEIVDIISIGFESDALTYDGEYWWVYKSSTNELYCFDQNGDYVSSFPNPGTGSISGMGWDGQYLWLNSGYTNYQVDIEGNPGPYPHFNTEDGAVTIVGDKLVIGDSGYEEWCLVNVYDFYGNWLFWGVQNEGFSDCGFTALAYHDGIVWVAEWYDNSAEYNYNLSGRYYDDDGDWEHYSLVTDIDIENLTVCDADFINIAESSLGNIKAYFAEKEE